MLVTRGRILLDRDLDSWIAYALADERVTTLPLTPEIAVAAGRIDPRELRVDPADTILYATTLVEHAVLVTKDRALRAHDPARTLW